ncbi:50S ribosomal protein L13 [bacterium (Candidatus Gribaldobacteria) CG_4_9_14_3_um_filter_36_15]|uniref:Large ribosomal subunit protein uL13 n=3 Tax=Candidatus Gribaldobacteria TaxID=2798536 RepID=A0A2M7VK72_9BACT|nr:MAG: 50S ribosomal protein L13 [Parcubacteria group bacterium CG2_30_36_21]PIR91406.1 MAG: 50S ribosomal protein L13 [bacterium (Candidatus Gribaldobacteria) CG10_big_fil_rev_8_21_14_0_10_37_46]PJA02237.1 MAG: 50S ribosomal protein L13 [bacterium (Candidatus Gribaldobacteria) CG_4_10_14_0_2_um_filter_36_18]PJB09200.1 MAG: 50S ribosomal protein L13 [bacterium (Candidatus Gribaldobacteria) CG_4_9_14_3_um_filter_36_15]
MERKTHTIDAANKSLGRLAVEVAILLRGKEKPDFVPYKDMGDFVTVKNMEKVRITGKKLEQKMYYRHSGYIGSLKKTPMGIIFAKNPREVLRRAVLGMLPKNKLRAKQIKRLKVV